MIASDDSQIKKVRTHWLTTVCHPPPALDIAVHTAIFPPQRRLPKALIAFSFNAKSGEHRASIAAHPRNTRQPPSSFTVSKLKSAHANPFYDSWALSCQAFEWAGLMNSRLEFARATALFPATR